MCVTTFIRALDDAFLRHGRFDDVVPIGLPDDEARRSIWGRLIPVASRDGVDVAAFVVGSDGFSLADIEYAAPRLPAGAGGGRRPGVRTRGTRRPEHR